MADWTKLDEKLDKDKGSDPWAALDAKLGPTPQVEEKVPETKMAPQPSNTPITSAFLAQRGLAGLSGIGNALASSLADAVVGPVRTTMQLARGETPRPVNFDLTNKLVNAGIISKENLNPTGMLPKLVGAGVEGLTGQLPLALASGGGASIPGLLKLAAQGAGAGVGGELGQEALPNHPAIGNLLGSVLGGAAPNFAEAVAQKAIGLPSNPLLASPAAVNPQAAGPLQNIWKRAEVGTGVEPSINQLFPNAKRSLTQQEQINSALAKSFGESATDLKPDTFASAAKRIGQDFEDVAAKTGNIPLDVDYSLQHYGIQQKLADSTLSESEKNAVQRMLDNVSPNKYSSITGDQYQQLTKSGSQLDDLMGDNNSTVKRLAQGIRSSLDDAMQRAAPQDVVDQLRNARIQYKNMLMVKDFKPDSLGNIDPGSITSSRVSNYYPNAFKGQFGGQDQLEDILRGASLLKTPEGGATSNNLSNLFKYGAGAAGGYLLGEHLVPELLTSNPALLASGLAGAGVMAGAPIASRMLLNTDWYKNQLLKQALGQTPTYNPLLSSTSSILANRQ